MANKNYSASRFGTFKDCLQKYKLTYIDELVVENREFSVQKKGLVFHKIAEETQVGESYDSIYKRAENEIAYAVALHSLQNRQSRIQIVAVVYQWFFAAFTDCLVACKVFFGKLCRNLNP